MNTPRFIPALDEKTHDLDQHASQAAAKTVLIVDDDPEFIALLKEYLQASGYQVDGASDGVQGVKKIMVQDYECIVCDMIMPNLAGDMFYTAVERVKPHLCKRFIFMTGNQGDPKISAFVRRVRGLILWKPFEFHVLMEAVHAIEARAQGAGSTPM